MALHLEQLETRHLLVGSRGRTGVIGEEIVPRILGTIEDHANVVVASAQGSRTYSLRRDSKIGASVSRSQSSAARSGARHCWFHGCPPELHPQSLPSAQRHGRNSRNCFRRSRPYASADAFEKFTVVGELGDASPVDLVEGITERHFAIVMVVAITLAVGRDVDELVGLDARRRIRSTGDRRNVCRRSVIPRTQRPEKSGRHRKTS